MTTKQRGGARDGAGRPFAPAATIAHTRSLAAFIARGGLRKWAAKDIEALADALTSAATAIAAERAPAQEWQGEVL